MYSTNAGLLNVASPVFHSHARPTHEHQSTSEVISSSSIEVRNVLLYGVTSSHHRVHYEAQTFIVRNTLQCPLHVNVPSEENCAL